MVQIIIYWSLQQLLIFWPNQLDESPLSSLERGPSNWSKPSRNVAVYSTWFLFLVKNAVKTVFKRVIIKIVKVVCADVFCNVFMKSKKEGNHSVLVFCHGTVHSADHAVWKGYFFWISMPSVIGLRMNKNQMPLTRGSLVLNLCKNSFLNPLAFIVLALWPSKVAKWQGPTRSMGYVLNCY